MDRGAGIQKRKASGQAALFDASSDPEPPPLSIVAWGDREKLSYEKESLGFYITGHPISDFVEILKQRATHDTAGLRGLKESAENPPSDSNKLVSVGGVVTSVKEVVTKSGNRMGFATLEDMKGTVSVIVFSELYGRVHSLLKEDEPVFVRGSVDLEEDTVKLIAREVVRLRDLISMSPVEPGQPATDRRRETSPVRGEVHFHLPSSGITRDQLETLRVLLTNHQGETPAYIHLKELEKGETILELPDGMKVNPTPDLMREVDTLFGSPVTILQ